MVKKKLKISPTEIFIEYEYTNVTYYDSPTGHHGKGREIQMWSTYKVISLIPLWLIIISIILAVVFIK